ncbi:hypothetical protein GOC43_21355 [Sinorhizobium meliloti]|nr:hypothetical protein [Sinorhizobium meliloti]
MGVCYIPEKYKCFTISELESQLSVAVAEHIQANCLTAIEIKERYPSIRAGHISKLLRGEPLCIKMLGAIAEATGMRWNLELAA